MQTNTSKSIVDVLPLHLAFERNVVPITVRDSTITLGILQTSSQIDLIPEFEFLTGKKIEIVYLSENELQQKLHEVYGAPPVVTTAKRQNGKFELIDKTTEPAKPAQNIDGFDDTPIISLVDQIITEAIETGASDIHIESYENRLRIRCRRDGVLHETTQPALSRKKALVSRLKIMAQLDIAEKRRPQDGRIRVKRDDRSVDIRVSTIPTDFGEKVVLRILDKERVELDLTKLGFDKPTLQQFKQAADSSYGMILVTGPTGSGKTTTLYSTLKYLNSPEVNILTIEDPIEYHLDGINQSHVRSDIGYTFAKALRAFLRQDPDIIMVGEIRDQETAEIAIRAALTGHLVLSTLHTNNAPGTLTRLLDIGLEPFLISSSVKMIIAQRLLRKLCPYCKTPDIEAIHDLEHHGVDLKKLKNMISYTSAGCTHCNDTGYSGRTAIFEVLPMSPQLAELIQRRADANEILEMARRCGMQTLQEIAIDKVKDGTTSIKEMLREIDFL